MFHAAGVRSCNVMQCMQLDRSWVLAHPPVDWCELNLTSVGAIQRISKVSASSYQPPGHHLSFLLLNLHAAGLMSPTVVVMRRPSYTSRKED